MATTIPQKRQCATSGQPARHSKQLRRTVPPFCSICQQHFKTNYVLRRHNATKHALSQLTCTEPGCIETFTRPDALERHLRNQHSDGKIPCPGCGKVFRKDVLHEHAEAPLNWRCALVMSKKLPVTPAESGAVFCTAEELRVINEAHESAVSNVRHAPRRDSSLTLTTSLSTGTGSGKTGSSANRSPPELDSDSHSSTHDLDNLQDHSFEESESTPDVHIVDRIDNFTSQYMEDSMQMSSNFAGPGPLWPMPLKSMSRTDPELWDDRVSLETGLVADPFTTFATDVMHTTSLQSHVKDVSDDMLFDLEIEDSADGYHERVVANQKQWDAMQDQYAHNDLAAGSTIRRSIKRYLRSSEFGQKIASVDWHDPCPICGHFAGSTKRALLRHAQVHIEHMPEPKFECRSCDIRFVFKTDRHLHCQPRLDHLAGSELQTRSDCESLRSQEENCWMLEATRQDYISELRCWEALQIKAYLDSVRLLVCQQFEGLQLETLRLSEAQVRLVASFLPKGAAFPNLSCNPRICADPVLGLDALTRSFARIDLECSGPPVQSGHIMELVGAASSAQCVVSFSPLVRALITKDSKEFSKLLKLRHKHICLNCAWYSLCWTCGAGKIDLVVDLLDSAILANAIQQPAMIHGISSNIFGAGGPLEIAMRYGRQDIVDELLLRGVRISSIFEVHADYFIGIAQRTRPVPGTHCQRLSPAPRAGAQGTSTGTLIRKGVVDIDQQGDRVRLERLIEAGIDIRTQYHGETLLNHCIKRRLPDVAGLLLEHGADLTMRDAEGYTSLHVAVKASDNKTLRLLLAQQDPVQACINTVSKDGLTALVLACERDVEQAVNALIEAGANPNVCSPLLTACNARLFGNNNAAGIVSALIRAGAIVDARDSSGATSLMYAVQNNIIPAVRHLVATGADVLLQDGLGRSALSRSEEGGDTTMARLLQACLLDAFRHDGWAGMALRHIFSMAPKQAYHTLTLMLDHGINFDSPDDKGDSIWHYTWKAQSAKPTRDAIRLLIMDAGISCNQQNTSGCTPLMLAVDSSRVETRTLLQYGALINLQDQDGNTALHHVCMRNSGSGITLLEKTAIVEMLIAGGAQLNLQNAYGRTAMMEASHSDVYVNIVSQLLHAGTDINIQDNAGYTALHHACVGDFAQVASFSRLAVVEMFIRRGAWLDIRNGSGRTPLMETSWCCAPNCAKIISLLVRNGANAYIRDSEGATPLTLAAAGRKVESVRGFLRAGVEVDTPAVLSMIWSLLCTGNQRSSRRAELLLI